MGVQSRQASGIAIALCLATACGGSTPPAKAPSSPTSEANPPNVPSAGATASAGDPFALPAGPRDDLTPLASGAMKLDAFDAAVKVKGLAASPPMCAAYARRTAASPAAADLPAALALGDPAKIDAALASLEPKMDAKEPGLVRALRADLAPKCADGIVDPYIASHRSLTGRAPSLLVGLSLAAKLERTGANPPVMPPTVVEKAQVKAFITGPLRTWMVEQSTAIETLSSGGAGLTGYGRGIAALGAGNADLRLVSVIRSAPTPPKWDAELQSIYQATLDEALEPRKRRGRDAALVGLGDIAQTGATNEQRVVDAHTLLGSLYSGRRIDALQQLLLPPRPVASKLPPFWTDAFQLQDDDLSAGASLHMREAFASPDAAKQSPATRTAYARARLEEGFRYWRRVDFVEAAYAAKPGQAPEDRLVLAIALALAQGPNGAAEMMRAASPAALELRHTEALDALVAENGPLAGYAAFDAAHIRSLAPPEGSEAGPFFRDLAARFRKAETLLTDADSKSRAHKRAEEIDAIVAAMDKR